MKLPQSIAAALYRPVVAASCSAAPGPAVMPEFKPNKILILSKVTRYEFEHKFHRELQEDRLEDLLRKRGSDFSRLRVKHEQHHDYVDTIQKELENVGIESKVVQRFDYNEAAVQWADCVLSAGGDGTFLMAASRIRDPSKPVIGINTDPQGSEGYMCLLRKLPKEHFATAFKRLLAGDFQWLLRQRIRITLVGEDGIGDAIELHDQQLNRNPATSRWTDNPRDMGGELHSYSDQHELDDHILPVKRSRICDERVTVELPYLALNEVFVAESLSSRVSYYEIQLDEGKMVKQKSSGITICTGTAATGFWWSWPIKLGTGSTSWYFNINKLTDQCVGELMKIISARCNVDLPSENQAIISDICTQFNQQLIFEPEDPKMAFSVRDPVFNATFPPTAPRGFANKISVKSRGYDAHLVIDGGVSYRFNDGAEAHLEVRKEDCLRTIVFR